MFIEMAIQFNSPLQENKNYSSLVPVGAISSLCGKDVWSATRSTQPELWSENFVLEKVLVLFL